MESEVFIGEISQINVLFSHLYIRVWLDLIVL